MTEDVRIAPEPSSMAEPRPLRSRALRFAGWIVVGVLFGLYIGLPLAMAIAATWPSRAAVGGPPAAFREETLATADGVALAAWYTPPKNGVAIIVVHGAGGSRENMRRQAVMLADDGYGVLSLDMRGHGKSGGRTNRLGWRGTRDVQAAAEFLVHQDGVRSIGAVGSSMGGEVLLGASATCPQIRAIVADGATRRCTAELLSLRSERPVVRSFTARVMYSAVRAFAWESPPAPLLDEMKRSDATEFLLVAAGGNDLEVAFNRLFARELGERASLWVAPGVGHTGALSRYPEEYERRVLGFLDANLLSR